LAEYRVASSSLEQVATGARWLEGPVWFGDGRYLLVSDIRGRFLSRLHCQSWVSIIFLLRHPHLPDEHSTNAMSESIFVKAASLSLKFIAYHRIS
jgi:sugar lactone lactonase YvrE